MLLVTDRLRTTLLLILVAGVSLAIRVPMALRQTRLTPDAISYYNIAGNLANVHGFTSTLLLRASSHSEVTHPAVADWPPVYPLFAGLIVHCGGDTRTLQLANALLISLASGLVFLIGSRLFDRRAGLIAGLAAALAPNLSRASTIALSDALSLALALSAIAMALSSRRTIVWLMVGVVTGLATLTRYPTAIVAVAVAVPGFLSRATRRAAAVCATAFACTICPVLIWQSAATKSAFGQTQAIHYCVQSFHSALWNAGSRLDPLYAAHHPLGVLASAARNTTFYSLDLLVGLRGLFLLSVGLIMISRRMRLNADRRLLLIIAALNLCVYSLTWSIPAVRGSRFLLLSYCLLLPFCAAGISEMLANAHRLRGYAAAGLCVVTVAAYAWANTSTAAFKGQEFPLPPNVTAAIAADLPPGTNIATNNPWVVSYSTGQPTALLPRDLDEQLLARFTRDMRIGEIVLIGKHPRFRTARVVRGCCTNRTISRTVRLATIGRPLYGQNAYDGKWKIMPQIVQKLPTTHSPSMIPRKNGSARL